MLSSLKVKSNSLQGVMGALAIYTLVVVPFFVYIAKAQYTINQTTSLIAHDFREYTNLLYAQTKGLDCRGAEGIGDPLLTYVTAYLYYLACVAGKFNTDWFVCWGDSSCAYSDILTSSDRGARYCYASKSCYGATINLNNEFVSNVRIQCDGYKSCARAEIKGAHYVYASGAYSLANAYIESAQPDGATRFQLSLYGHRAGYGLRVHCKTNHFCNIGCWGGDSCENFLLDCDGTCYLNSSTSVDFTSPDGLKYANLDDYAHKINVQCEINQNFVFDMYREKRDQALIDSGNDPLCCRGYQSCYGVDKMMSNDVLCSGRSSCNGGGNDVRSSANLICTGSSSCGKNLVVTETLYCLGSGSCSFNNVNISGDVYCAANDACRGTNFDSQGDVNFHFIGYDSGRTASVICNVGDICNIVCLGEGSCDSLTIQSFGSCNLHCDETNSLFKCNKITYLNGASCSTGSPTPSPTSPTSFPTVYPSAKPSIENLNTDQAVEPTLSTGSSQSSAPESNLNVDFSSTAFIVAMASIIVLILIVCCYGLYTRKLKKQIAHKQDADNLAMSAVPYPQSQSMSSKPVYANQLDMPQKAEHGQHAQQESASGAYHVDVEGNATVNGNANTAGYTA